MTEKSTRPPPNGGGLNALKNNPTQSHCNSPGRPYLKAHANDKKTVFFIRPNCKSWSCKPCAELRAASWRHIARMGGDALLADGHDLCFVTLTSHRLVRSLNAGIVVWRKAWPKLSARWRRASPGVQYCYVAEQGKAGHFHVHFITTATVAERWYKDNGAKTGLGYMAKAKPVLYGWQCGAYITKYLTKAIACHGWPKYWRRVNTSRKWPRIPVTESELEWLALGSDTVLVKYAIANYERLGWKVEHALPELDATQ